MTNPDEERQFTQYLLGALSEGEMERLEEQALYDGELCERIALAEEELLDRYARGELAEPDRQRLEARLLTTPQQVERLRFATALDDTLHWLDIEVETDEPTPTDTSSASSSVVLPWRETAPSAPRQRRQWLPWAAGFLLLITAGWLLWENLALRADRERSTAQLATLAAEREAVADRLARLEAARTGGRMTVEKLEEEIRAGRETIARLEAALAGRAEAVAPAMAVSFVLGLGMRGGEPATAYRVPPAADTIVLDLILDGGGLDFPTFRALLRDLGGQEVWSRGGLIATKGRDEKGTRSVRLEIPAALLRDGEYVVTLLGVDEAGASEEVGFYDFPVTRR